MNTFMMKVIGVFGGVFGAIVQFMFVTLAFLTIFNHVYICAVHEIKIEEPGTDWYSFEYVPEKVDLNGNIIYGEGDIFDDDVYCRQITFE